MTSTKVRTRYRCGACGHEHTKWVGRCEGCAAWNTVAEETLRPAATRHPPATVTSLADAAAPLERWRTGLDEFDHVLGGGLVPGSMVLIGGEPGIGKSTLLLQAAAQAQGRGRSVLYATAEESPDQLRLRAARLDEDVGPVQVAAHTSVETLLDAARQLDADVLIVDSIQTVGTDTVDTVPGSVTQVRESAAVLMRFAKETGVAVVVVGHVTKGGGIAGPKTLEHIVDTVLYFEGEGALDHRLLRATKNRFGSVDELGVFAMTGRGLVPVPDPSAAFLEARADGSSGTAVTALLEGTRPMLVEIQALTAPTGYGTPQRVATGLDPKRLAVLLAVLDRRAGITLTGHDVFVQVSAGVRLTEPAADLAVVAALISSLRQAPTPADALFLGEVGLGGDVRPASGSDRRLAEAVQHGFHRCFTSARAASRVEGVTLVGLQSVDQLERAFHA